MKIAIISDLHIGDQARAKDLSPDDNENALDDKYIDAFLEFIEEKKIKCDYLLIAGDVSNKARTTEFELASNFLSMVADKLQLDINNVIIVPGNHDVDWSVLKEPDSTGLRNRQKYDPFKYEKFVFSEIISNADKDFTQEPFFSVWKKDNLLVVGFNSSWHDNPEIAIHNGIISEQSIKNLGNYLDSQRIEKNIMKIFLVHHHPVQYSDPIPDRPDFSIMTNSENLLKMLRKFEFDFLIHGHKHVPKFQTRSINSGFPLCILSAGSFSALLETRWSGFVNNQFHLLTIEHRDQDTNVIKGYVENWSFLSGKGWIQSEKHNGIPYRVPFGTHLSINYISNQISKYISDEIKEKKFVKWKEITTFLPELIYLPLESQEELFVKIELEHGVEMYESVGERLFLVKD